MLGSDLRRVWWGAWGDPRGFVPRMADYFKLCNIAKSDAQVLDQIGEMLEPKLVGSWIGVWGAGAGSLIEPGEGDGALRRGGRRFGTEADEVVGSG